MWATLGSSYVTAYSVSPITFFCVSNRIREHDTVHEEIHDSNTVHGRVGPGYVLHWRPAFPWSVAVGRKELCYLQMGQRE